MSTALAEAFKDAGWKHPNERLLEIAIEAWRKWSTSEAGGARRNFVVNHLRGEMTWSLIEQWQPNVLPQAVGALLNMASEIVKNQDRDAAKAAGRGQYASDTQSRLAPADLSGRKPDDGGQTSSDIHSRRASVTPFRDEAKPQASPRSEPASRAATSIVMSPAAPTLKVLADKQAARAATSITVRIQLCRLDTVFIGTKKIGDCTIGEVKLWAATRLSDQRAAGRDARFALSLVANLPAGYIVREWWKNTAEVDAMYEKAELENAA